MRKMDEMELQHTLQAIRGAFLYSLIFEVICWIMACVRSGDLVFTNMFYLIVTQSCVLFVGQLYFKSKVGDSKAKNGLVFIAIVTILAIIVGLLIAFFVG